MCDLKAIFHQVNVNVEDQNIFCWKDDNLNKTPLMYRVITSLCSDVISRCTNVGLRKTADDHENDCVTEAANFLRDNF